MENKTQLKILHFHFGRDGGAEQFFVSLAQALNERGVAQQFVIRPNRAWRGGLVSLGETTECNFRYVSFPRFWLQWRVRRIIKEWQPNAVLAWAPRASRLLPNYPGVMKFTRLGDYPMKKMINRHFKYADALIVNTPDIGRHAKEIGWHRPIYPITNFAKKVEINPVTRKKLYTPEDAFVISCAARFVWRKGIDVVIRAAARVPNAWLWIIGDGEEKQALESLTKEVGMTERTRFIGWVQDPINYVAATDVFGMPSRHEPLGNAVLDAWWGGVPVVSTRSEGPAWFMTDEKNGVLVDIDDTDAFVAALNKIRNDKPFAGMLVVGGKAELQGRFSRNYITEQYIELLTTGRLTADRE